MPNQALIAQWLQEQRHLDDERDALRIADQGNTERVFSLYGPLAQALYWPAAPA